MAEAISEALDAGSRITQTGGGAVSMTAGGSGDNTEVVGAWFDTLGIPPSTGTHLGVEGVRFASGAIIFTFNATLGAGEKLTLKTIKLESCNPDADGQPDAATATEFGSDDSVATVDVATATGLGSHKVSRTFMGAKQFIRVKWTPDLSRASTDTAVIAAALVLGGSHVPADQPR